MSEKSTPKETLSINCQFSIVTGKEEHVLTFIADLTELLTEWRKKVKISTQTISTVDYRDLERFEEEDKK